MVKKLKKKLEGGMTELQFASAIGIPAIFISQKFKRYLLGANEVLGKTREVSERLNKLSQLSNN
ncbi:hypothetical protein [Fluviispira sanaruensis]|uniref:Uncharacterized protein n=1 Tax=Fluviispira sanaruensis TaxID=2493639 RepID=A0A4P2VRP1_FLUSA|nr:hypothetical protein [Fluviispira sanaruensis]BBH51815.1 hypothetical protein JCM31447_02370 [Fluviispira sanaruensis]